MITVKLTVSYDGTEYVGWQSQRNGVSVQDTIENALLKICKKPVRITGSGRTDAGVHAEGQVAHFKTDSTVPPEKFSKAINALLPQDIRILKSERAEDGFNARYSAKKKTYVYNAYVSEISQPLKDRYFLQLESMPDMERMKEAAAIFIGEHDFKSFSSTGSNVKTTVRTIYSFSVENSGENITLKVCGSGFLYNMVRILVGTVFAYGLGKIDREQIEAALNGEPRPNACKTLAAKGLTLFSVDYD